MCSTNQYNRQQTMQESQLRDLIAKGLPKIAVAAIAGIYPLEFEVQPQPSRDILLQEQLVGHQLIYTQNIQILSFLSMDPGQIITLGHRAFVKSTRAEIPRLVISANGEAQNTIMAKLGFLIGRIDGDVNVIVTPPIVINCSGDDARVIPGGDSVIVNLLCKDIAIRFAVVVQMV